MKYAINSNKRASDTAVHQMRQLLVNGFCVCVCVCVCMCVCVRCSASCWFYYKNFKMT